MPPRLATKLSGQIAGLIGLEQIKVLTIEEFSPHSGRWTCKGIGVSGFVDRALIDAHLAAPKPFFLVDLLDRTAAGAAVFLAPPDIGHANANGGLDLVVEYMQGGWDLDDPVWRAVVTIAHEAYVKHHRGYRLQRALQEFWSAQSDAYLPAGYSALETFELSAEQLQSLSLRFDTRRTLCYADGTAPPGQTVANAFQYDEPRCGFSPTEQRVLLRAADGLTDQEIANDLGCSANSIKQSWRMIYTRVQGGVPFILANDGVRETNGTRGPEKRRRVIAYVEAHPQELRPFFLGRRVNSA